MAATQQHMTTLADRSDLAPRARHLLAQQLAECDGLLEPLLRGVLDDLEHELFRIGEQSSGGQAQHEALQALTEVKRNRPRFQGRVMALLERRFAAIGHGDRAAPPPGAALPSGEDLALVDPHEFDESMALDDLSTRTELHAGNAIFDLCHRYAVLAAMPPLDNDALPPAPHTLAAVLGEAAADLGLQRTHRLLFYRLCDRRLFAAAEAFYAHLNEHLKAAGILPDLRSYLPKRKAAEARPAPAPTADAVAPSDASAPMAPAINFTPPPDPPAAELHALLDARRRALNADNAAAAAAQSAQFASMPELQEALSALQALPSRKNGLPRPGERLDGELMAELRRAMHGQSVQLQPEHRDALDLIGLLYDQLLSETRTQGVAQQLLGNLQVPLLRVALSDSNFFTVRNHPARRLLNLVLETANLWLDRSDEKFDAALNQRLQRSVRRVVDNYKGDLGVIEREADELDNQLKLIARRAEIAERRQVEAAQGRNRLREARSVAGKAIEQRLAKHKTTPLVHALLQNAWTDALTLTLLRDGEDSEAYRRRLAAVDQLLEAPTGRDDARLAADFNHGLTQVGLQATEAEQITRYALDQPQAPAAPTSAPTPTQTELLIRLKARHKPDDDEAAPGKPAPRKLSLTPSERRALATLKQLPFGTWLEFTINQQGQKAARKLAWYAPASGRCLLVSARGTAAPERTLEQVARRMARGQIRVLPRQDAGMIDRAWNALLAGLRKFGKTNENTVPAT